MSRSKRKTPVVSITTADSERFDKQKWHRRFRKKVRETISKLLNSDVDADNVVFPHENEIIDEWDMRKDGKQYLSNDSDRDEFMRK